MALRAESRTREKEAKEKSKLLVKICNNYLCLFLELWVLLFWESENSVSVHGGDEEVKTQLPATIGNDCEVTIKGNKYTGKIADTGRLLH